MITTLAILGLAVGLLVSDRVRPDLVAMLAATALVVTGVLAPEVAFAGFGSRAVITIIAVSILAEGLRTSGVAKQLGQTLLRVSGSAEWRVVAVWMLCGAVVSLFMNNIAAAALLLPAASVAGRRAGVSPSRLMMPLAFGTILGGMATLLTSSNLIVSDLLDDAGYRGFGLFDFVPIGLPIVAVGMAWVVFVGRRRLPAQVPGAVDAVTRQHLADVYQLGERMRRARIPADSPLVGRTLGESGIRERVGLWVTGVERGTTRHAQPPADFRFEAGDLLELMGRASGQDGELLGWFEVLPGETAPPHDVPDNVIVEAVLAPRSSLHGRTPRDVRFRERFGMTILALWRGDRPVRSGIGDLEFRMGDALLLQGAPEELHRLKGSDDLIVLSADDMDQPATPAKARAAVVLLVVALAFGVRFPGALGAILLLAGLLMVPAGILSMDRVHHAIDWRTVFLVAGMLPLGVALSETGAAGMLADGIAGLLGPVGPWAVLAGVFMVSAVLTQAVVGPAVAAMMAPVAIQAAVQTGTDPRAMGMAVALACSMAFLTPLGHPVNVLVMGPGGYRFGDYRRVGLPMAALLAVVVIVGLPLLFGM